jgi:CRISPR-associated protein Cas2
MQRANFIITYDISDEKRLAKIGKTTEKEAFRIQRSVYFYPDATIEELSVFLEKITKLIHEQKDDLRVYKIKKGGIALQSGVDLDDPYVFLEV